MAWKNVKYKDGKYKTDNSGGGSGHDYSTSEQVIGTWIDGKPLYEKVLEDSRQGGFPSGDYEIYSNASSFHLIPDGLFGMFYNSAGSQYLVPWASCGGSSTNSTSLYKNSSGKIILAVRNDSYETYALELVIRYTKTTD